METSYETPTLGRMFDFRSVPGVAIGSRLKLASDGTMRAVFLGSVPIYRYEVSDREAEKACIAFLSSGDLAFDVDIAEAFNIHRNTVGRYARLFKQDGLQSILRRKPGPRGPHKVNDQVREVINRCKGLGATAVARQVAEETGVTLSVTHVYRLLGAQQQQLPQVVDDHLQGAASARVEPEQGSGSRGEGPHAEEPEVVVPKAVRGRYMGAALYFPALERLGLLEAARSHFRLTTSRRFGVRETFLTLFFLSILGHSTVESAKHLVRESFGALVGTGVAPCVKTLRRKLGELVGQATTSSFELEMARRWMQSGVVMGAYLYVDGHMKVYSGKHKLQKVWNPQRKMPLPGLISYFVGDQRGRPLLFVTDDVCPSLAKSMPRIVREIRAVVGKQPFTVVFDRGGYNGQLFEWLVKEGIDFITYQRGAPHLPSGSFVRREARFEGQRLRFWIAEDEVKVRKGGPWRRIVVLTRGNGHQTPILTSLSKEQIAAGRVAALMVARWRQENFFRYMRQHQGLDQLVSYAWEEAPDSLIPNPEHKRLNREIAAKRRQAVGMRAELGRIAHMRVLPRSRSAMAKAEADAAAAVSSVEKEVDELVALRKACPSHIRLSESGCERDILRLGHKRLVDRIKITAYNAEEWTLDILRRHYSNPNDVRDLLRSFAHLSGEMRRSGDRLAITLDPPDTPLHHRALNGLCDDLNAIRPTYPGTDMPVVYRVAVHNSARAS